VGCVPPEDSVCDAIVAIRAAAAGEAHFSPRATAALLGRVREAAAERNSKYEAARLSPRQVQVLRLIEQGLSNKEIGANLSIEVATVKNHVHSILHKLNLHRRIEVVAWSKDLRSTETVDDRATIRSSH
jgi:DNA-binding NarL/FixJ family response regulator